MNSKLDKRLGKIIAHKPITKTQNKLKIGFIIGSVCLLVFLSAFFVALGFFDQQEYRRYRLPPREIARMERKEKPEKPAKFDNKVEIIGIEFVLLAIILIIIAILIYRQTDWKMVKYPKILIVLVILAVLLFGLIVFAFFERDARVPKFIREQRFHQGL